jgi:hypothetical protein
VVSPVEGQACCYRLLKGFLDLAATEAACADPNPFGLTIDQCSDWLEVGLEDSLGLVIGVTNIMARLTTFATEIACKCHGYTPSSSRIGTRIGTVEMYHRAIRLDKQVARSRPL